MTSPISGDLQCYLQEARECMVRSLEGLSEYDIRRPMTPTGTNLLGLVLPARTQEVLQGLHAAVCDAQPYEFVRRLVGSPGAERGIDSHES